MNDLGKKPWQWMQGMSTDGMLVVDADETGISIVRKGAIQDHWAPEEALPDLPDPATLGCLLAQVSHQAQLEVKATILEASSAPPKGKMHQVQEPLPVNDILKRVFMEITINGFTQPLLIGNLLLQALEVTE